MGKVHNPLSLHYGWFIGIPSLWMIIPSMLARMITEQIINRNFQHCSNTKITKRDRKVIYHYLGRILLFYLFDTWEVQFHYLPIIVGISQPMKVIAMVIPINHE